MIYSFQVQVKTMDGTRIGIDFKGTATLADLKGLLHKNLGLPKDVQRFALIGQLLDDDRDGGLLLVHLSTLLVYFT